MKQRTWNHYHGQGKSAVMTVLLMLIVGSIFLIASGQGQEGLVYGAQKTSVGTEAALQKAVQKSGTIIVTKNITVKHPVVIPDGVNVTLQGKKGSEKLLASKKAYWAVGYANTALLQVDGTAAVNNLTVHANNVLRAVYIADTGSLTMGSGAVIRGGVMGLQSQRNNDFGAGIQVGSLTGGTAGVHARLVMKKGSMIRDCHAAGARPVVGIGMGIGRYGEVQINGGVIKKCTDLYSGDNSRWYSDGGGIAFAYSHGSVTMNSGKIINNYAQSDGGGIYVDQKSNKLTVRGGTISGNRSRQTGGGVYNNGMFDFSGGIIEKNSCVETVNSVNSGCGGGIYNSQGGNLTMSGGSIRNNTAGTTHTNQRFRFIAGQGGGIFLAGTVTMTGGEITGNAAYCNGTADENAGNGGGVAIAGGELQEVQTAWTPPTTGTFIMTAGSISGNTANQKGGGVYMNNVWVDKGLNDPDATYTSGSGSFEIGGAPVITGNEAAGGPGNVFLPAETVMTIRDHMNTAASIMVSSASTANGTVIAESSAGTLQETDAAVFTDDAGQKCYGVSGSRLVRVSGGSETPEEPQPVSLEDSCRIELSATELPYSGEDNYPVVAVRSNDGGVTLTEGTDYQVEYPETSKTLGEYHFTVRGLGSYTGSLSGTYYVVQKPIQDVKIKVSDRVYTGSPVQAVPDSVKNGSELLMRGEDYRILTDTYKNNTKAGKASVTLEGLENYTGTTVMEFVIVPAATDLKSIVSAKTGAMTVKWKKNGQADGYQILLATDLKFSKGKKTVAAGGGTTVTKAVSGLTAGKTYYVKVRAYKSVGGTKHYGPYGSIMKIKVL